MTTWCRCTASYPLLMHLFQLVDNVLLNFAHLAIAPDRLTLRLVEANPRFALAVNEHDFMLALVQRIADDHLMTVAFERGP